jgi:hypothetical protein
MAKLGSRRRKLLLIALLPVAVLLAFGVYAYRGDRPKPLPGLPSFDGDSGALKHTVVAATLDGEIREGQSTIWCASFQAAWKSLQTNLYKGPVSLEGGGPLVDALNRAPSPRADAPAGSLYTASGWEDKGILQKIRTDLQQRFPSAPAPTFPGIIPGSFVAYSYLEAGVRFRQPYFQSRKPLPFTDSTGTKAMVASFGIRPEDDYAYNELRMQPRLFLEDMGGGGHAPMVDGVLRPAEFIIDLDRESEPTQVVLAVVTPGRTLGETIRSVERKMASSTMPRNRDGLGSRDVLLVPDIFWRISHHFSELEGRRIQNAALKGQRLDVAQQDLVFRLDRGGAELRVESKMYAKPVPTAYVFDRPFLIYLKKRGAARPYFVMWVDSAELLRPMSAD